MMRLVWFVFKLCDRGDCVSGLTRRARRWHKVGGEAGESDTSLSHSSQFEVKRKRSVINKARN